MLIECFIIAACAFVFSVILTQEDKPFGFLKKLPLPEWIAKPLYKCQICASGQWALWTGILYHKILDFTVECWLGPWVVMLPTPDSIWMLIRMILLTMFWMWLIEKVRARL